MILDGNTVNSNVKNINMNDFVLLGIPRLRFCYALTFDYLQNIHEEMRIRMIGSERNQSKVDNAHGIATDIFNEFLAVDSVNEINISYESGQEIKEYFMKENSERSIADYLTIFDNSMCEIYCLLSSVYRFKYIGKNVGNEKNRT